MMAGGTDSLAIGVPPGMGGAWPRACRGGWLGQSGESCEPRAPAKLMMKAGGRRSFLTPLPQAPGAVIYPDSDDTGATGVPPVPGDRTDGVYGRVEYQYNRQR